MEQYIAYAILVLLDSSYGVIAVCKLISIPLSFIIIYYSNKIYKLTYFTTLQSFAIGFSFILVSDAFVLIRLFTETSYGNELMWIKSILMSYGFSFIAASYFFRSRSEKNLHSINRIFGLAIIPIVIMIGLLSALDKIDLFSFFTVEEYFRLFNLGILVYVVAHTSQNLIGNSNKKLLYLPLAFVLLWLGQFTALIYTLDGGDITFVLRVVLKTFGLGVFAAMILNTMRTKIQPKIEEKRRKS